MVAATRTMVSPCRTTTAPPACRAKSPASNEMVFPSISISIDFHLFWYLFLSIFIYLNLYSYLFVSGVAIAVSFFLVYRTFSLKAALFCALILVVAVALLRSSLTTASNELNGIEHWNSIRDSGSPVLLYLYSDL